MKVFISYSWTSEEYKNSVLQIAQALISNAVDVILDLWDLHPGQDRFAFMEHSIEQADKVLIFCDKRYAENANERQGGIGTETAIITPEVYSHHDQEKFIPVIMESFDCMPLYLKSRIGIDLRRENGFEELLRAIYNRPKYTKPPLGQPPEWISKETPSEEMIIKYAGDKRFTLAEMVSMTGKTESSLKPILAEMLENGLVIRAGNGYLVRKQGQSGPPKIRACIKVWQEIYSSDGKLLDVDALQYLDAIKYGPVHEVEEITSDLEETLINEFRNLNPDFEINKYEIHTDELM